MLSVMMTSAFIPGGAAGMVLGADIGQLANNDVLETGEKMYAWLSAQKEKFEEGEVSKETQEWVDEVTYGQGFGTFLGPNFPLAASTYEWLVHSTSGNSNTDIRHEWKNKAFKESVKRAVNKNENKESYDRLSWINSQAARTWAYTTSAWKSGGIKDAIWLEGGFFQNKEEKEWSQWLWGSKKKKKKYVPGTTLSKDQRKKALYSMSRL
jgi:hypothetical protein